MILLVLLLLLWPVSVGAVDREVLPGLTVAGWDRLTQPYQRQLLAILEAVPRAWYPRLRVITVDNAPIPEPLASETCRYFESYGGPCKINIFSSGAWTEDAFPSDAPERVSISVFTTVVLHELAHQLDVVAWRDRNGWLGPWRSQIIAEAGCEPTHYLRSMLPACYFRENPQEFVASIFNQWGTCSRCALRLALARWDRGIVHPLNSLIYYVAVTGFRTALVDDDGRGMVVAFDTVGGVPMPEWWTVSPWRCGGTGTLAGPGWAVVLTTDAQCRVTAVGEREGV